MPAGDAQRVWFPEMLEELRLFWTESTSWEDLAGFCERMMPRRKEVRRARGIRPPRMRCPDCGNVSRSDIPGISIRSALFGLKNDGVIADGDFQALDSAWKKYRARHDLDSYGRRNDGRRSKVPNCGGGNADHCSASEN
jgi:hypothetical protein